MIYLEGNDVLSNTSTNSNSDDRYASRGNYRVYRTDYLTVRKEPNITADEIGKLSPGDIVSVNTSKHYGETINGFAEIEYQGGKGYVIPSYLEHVSGGELLPGGEMEFYVTNETVYGWPSDSAEILGVIDSGLVYLLSYNQERGFSLVISKYGMGFVKQQFDMH